MKRISIFLSAVLIAALSLSLWTAPAAQAVSLPDEEISAGLPSSEITVFEDGSYMETTLIVSQASTLSTSTVSGSKKTTYYNSSGTAMFDFTVTGTFRYTGSSATATAASYSYNIYNSGWSLKTATAYCSGNQAIAEGTFKRLLLWTHNATITLTCSSTGVLS